MSLYVVTLTKSADVFFGNFNYLYRACVHAGRKRSHVELKPVPRNTAISTWPLIFEARIPSDTALITVVETPES